MHELDDLTPIHVIVTAKGQVSFELAGLEDSPESVGTGYVDAALPARHRRLCGSESGGELRLAQTRELPRLTDELGRVQTTQRR